MIIERRHGTNPPVPFTFVATFRYVGFGSTRDLDIVIN
jgi:hypothetical protein